MIPKRAIFFWEGPAMSWLRAQSIETFKALNPDWKVSVIDGGDIPISPDSRLNIVQRSDWARYRELYRNGGVYFDTDILFVRPVPDSWLDHDLILSKNHIATMGCSAGDQFFGIMDMGCKDIFNRGRMTSYQNYGMHLFTKMAPSVIGRDVFWLDIDTVLPVLWDHTEEIWNDSSKALGPSTIGIHWYGGDYLSRKIESLAGSDWANTSDCIVARAFRKVMVTSNV